LSLVTKLLKNPFFQSDIPTSLYERPERLGDSLPYDEYLPEHGLFQLKDGSLGAVFEANLLEHEVMAGVEVAKIVSGLKTWFNLPTNCTLQVLFDQGVLSKKTFEDPLYGGHSVSKLVMGENFKVLRERTSRTSLNPLLGRKLYISIRFFPEKTKTINGFLKSSSSTLLQEVKASAIEIRKFLSLLETFKANSEIKFKSLSGQELVDILRKFFNPVQFLEGGFAPYNPSRSISEQLVYSTLKLSNSSIERECIKTKTLCILTPPAEVHPGAMAYFTTLPFPFKMSLNFKFPTQAQSKRFLDLKEFFLQNTPTAKSKIQRTDVLEALDGLAKGEKIVHATFTLILEAFDDEKLQSYTREAINIFQNKLGCNVLVDEIIGCGLALSTLPLNYLPITDFSSQRFMRLKNVDVVNLLPIFDSYRGTPNALQYFESREKNLVPFSTNTSGFAGHSVYLGDDDVELSRIVRDYYTTIKAKSPEPLVFILDSNSSHGTACQFFEGDATQFDRTKDMPFSPFRGQYDELKISFLTQFLVTAARLTAPSFQIESGHVESLAKSIRLAYERKANELGLSYQDGKLVKVNSDSPIEIRVEDIIVELASLPSLPQYEGLRQASSEISEKLRPFYGEGIYAKYFRGGQKAYTETSFYLYDLEGLSSDPTLQTLMTMAVIEEVIRLINLDTNKDRGGVLIIERLGLLGRNNPEVSKFIIDASETLKKKGVSLIAVSSRPSDFFETEAGRATWAIADNFFFLKLSQDNLKFLKEKSDLLTPVDYQIIGSLHTKGGENTDVFYKNKKGAHCGSFRSSHTKFSRWLGPAHDLDSKIIQREFKKNKTDPMQALISLGNQNGKPEGSVT
jgi:hypothetical protein